MNTKNNTHKSYYFFYFFTLWFAIIFAIFLRSDLWHRKHFINYGISIESIECRITNYGNYSMIQKPILA